MVTSFVSSLGQIAQAVKCFESLHGAYDLITELYCDRSSLMRMVVFTLTDDCAGCFAVILAIGPFCAFTYMIGAGP